MSAKAGRHEEEDRMRAKFLDMPELEKRLRPLSKDWKPKWLPKPAPVKSKMRAL